MILTWLILIPAIGGLISLISARWSSLAARWAAVIACLIDLGLAIKLCLNISGLKLIEQNMPWVSRFGINYHLAIDGLSLLLVVLTAVIVPIAIIGSWREIEDRVGAFYFSVMALMSGILGVFLARDMLLFYLFWELMLVPMYFIIGIWGHENRLKAAIKFFLFTFFSGLLMLLSIIWLYVINGRATGVYTFDYGALMSAASSIPYAWILMLGFFIAFAVKLPAIPVHTWLPDAHTEAPTAGSVILAGLLLKTGAYGFLRFIGPFCPVGSVYAVAAMWLGVAGILYGAVLSYAQSDLKRMVAYSSISHMGFVLLGIYAGTPFALQGAIIQIISHGISTGALFLIVGMIQDRTGTRDLGKLGGLWSAVPKIGGFTLFFAVASLALPGFGNFVGEFLVLLGTFQVNWLIASLAAVGMIFSAIYSMRLFQASMLGPNKMNWNLMDLTVREITVLSVLAVLILWIGLYPKPIFNVTDHYLLPFYHVPPDAAERSSR